MKKPDQPAAEASRLPARKRSSTTEIAAFLSAARRADPTHTGRLIFALDATMSRQPTWDRAMATQTAMFDAVGQAGGLSVQLVFFRGFGECRASKWVVNAAALRDLMTGIQCRGGHTQLGKVLEHARRETEKARVAALVFIGDALEEDVDHLCNKAGELGLLGVRGFFFQDGYDPLVERTFKEMARLTNGAFFRLGPASARDLAGLLGAIAVYAHGGLKALNDSSRSAARLLLEQMNR